jgi:hypothetical protein
MTLDMLNEDDGLDRVDITEEDDANLRSERAADILDEIGTVEPDYRLGITDTAAIFVEEMQDRLADCRARRIELACSEKQLAWLESIQEKLDS